MKSPNPKGRPSIAQEVGIVEAAKKAGDVGKIQAALDRLYAIGMNPKAPISVQEKALVDWLTFYQPKAPQAVQVQTAVEYQIKIPGISDNLDEIGTVIEMPALLDGKEGQSCFLQVFTSWV